MSYISLVYFQLTLLMLQTAVTVLIVFNTEEFKLLHNSCFCASGSINLATHIYWLCTIGSIQLVLHNWSRTIGVAQLVLYNRHLLSNRLMSIPIPDPNNFSLYVFDKGILIKSIFQSEMSQVKITP